MKIFFPESGCALCTGDHYTRQNTVIIKIMLTLDIVKRMDCRGQKRKQRQFRRPFISFMEVKDDGLKACGHWRW